MQIDWSKAPDWAQFVAMDECGDWFWYAQKPDDTIRVERWCPTDDEKKYEFVEVDWRQTLMARPEPVLIGTNISLSWADSEDDKPESRADLRRVLTEWNDVTGALPRDSGWMCEVLGMMEDAYDLGAHQAAKDPTK